MRQTHTHKIETITYTKERERNNYIHKREREREIVRQSERMKYIRTHECFICQLNTRQISQHRILSNNYAKSAYFLSQYLFVFTTISVGSTFLFLSNLTVRGRMHRRVNVQMCVLCVRLSLVSKIKKKRKETITSGSGWSEVMQCQTSNNDNFCITHHLFDHKRR